MNKYQIAMVAGEDMKAERREKLAKVMLYHQNNALVNKSEIAMVAMYDSCFYLVRSISTSTQT